MTQTNTPDALEAFAETAFNLNMRPPGWGSLGEKWEDQSEVNKDTLRAYYGKKIDPIRAALTRSGEAEAVAWQFRTRTAPHCNWSPWRDGRALQQLPVEVERIVEWEERALYDRPAPARLPSREEVSDKAELAFLGRLVKSIRFSLESIADDIQDEGGRVYFGSTNDADRLKDLAEKAATWQMEKAIKSAELPDLYGTIKSLRERAEKAEAELASLLTPGVEG